MKNIIYKALIIILVLSFLVSCSKAKPGSSSAGSSENGISSDVSVASDVAVSSETAVSSEQSGQNSQSVTIPSNSNSNFDSIKGTVVKVHIGTSPNDVDKAKAKEFEKKYGCKVEFNSTSWTEWKTAFPQSVASKNPVDFIYTSDQDFINYAAKNLIMPIDQYINMSETKYYEKSIMDLFKWKGKRYLMQSALSKLDTFGFIFYNKTMFEDAGEKEPIAYYKEGKWNFDTFREVARKMSKDTDGDGKIDVRGFASWWYDSLIEMNGNSQIVIKDNGTLTITLNQPSAYTAMQLISDMQLKDKSFEWNVNQGDMFLNSKVAMVFERAWNAVGSYELYDKNTFPDDIGICPPPKGTNSGDKYYAPALFTGYAIPTGAKNPLGAVAWYRFSQQYKIDHEKDAKQVQLRRTMISDEHLKIAEDFFKICTPINSQINSIGGWYFSRWGMWSGVLRDNIPPATAVAQNINVLNNEISQTIKNQNSGAIND